MDNTTDLNPQVPGQTPGVDAHVLAPLLELTLADLVAGLPALTDVELDELHVLEAAGENREAYADALTSEQERRLEAATRPSAPAPEQVAVRAGAPDYARMAATDIDPKTLTSRVLSKDGWVLPAPAASAE